MSKPSTDLTILGDKKEARVNMGDEKVIKKLEVVKQESCKRIRRLCVFLKKRNNGYFWFADLVCL